MSDDNNDNGKGVSRRTCWERPQLPRAVGLAGWRRFRSTTAADAQTEDRCAESSGGTACQPEDGKCFQRELTNTTCSSERPVEGVYRPFRRPCAN
jgi:hypothetical protein